MNTTFFFTPTQRSRLARSPLVTDELSVDLLSITGHKLYGPKGVGAPFVREHVRLEPLIHGGSHESGRRAGTDNILLGVGLGSACVTGQPWLGMESGRQLRDFFWNLLQDAFTRIESNEDSIRNRNGRDPFQPRANDH
jgi:cysteine desulfurase